MDDTPDNKIQQKQKEGALKSSFFFFILVFLSAVAIDQLSKHWAQAIFKNSNFAFSLPLPPWLMYGIYFFVFTGMIIYLSRNYRVLGFLPRLAWSIIFAGAVSNILERIFIGYVRDFIYITFLKWTGIYNLADFFIIVGIVLLIVPFHDSKKINDL